jgi:hypothetical protein
MAYNVTTRAKNLFSQTEITPNLVVEIDGYPNKFTADPTKTVARFGENNIVFGQPGLTFGGLIELLDQSNLISLSGTSTEIQQQLEPDQGNVSSVQKLNIRLVDLNEEATRLISPSFVFEDILYRFAKVYLGPTQGSFPEDYIELFNGNIQGVKAGAGYVDLEVAHPEDVRRAKIFTKVEQILTEDLNFNSVAIQGLFFQAFGDVTGLVRVEFVVGAGGDNAIVTVAGQDISIAIDPSATKISTIKRVVENNADANQVLQVSFVEGANKNQIAALTGGFVNLVSDTAINLDDVSLFLNPVDPLFKTYVQIGEEIIEYTGVDLVNNQLTGCVRSSLNTFGNSHKAGDTAASFYKLGDATQENGNAIDLALQVYLSGAEEFYAIDVPVLAMAEYGVQSAISNAIYFKNVDLERDFGVTVGDTIDIYDSVSNNITGLEIIGVEQGSGFSYLLVDQTLNIEGEGASVRLKSRFNTLPDGLGLKPNQVDILRFLDIKRLYFSSIALYEIYLKDTVTASEFINKTLYLPSALFSIPRRGRIGVGFTAPPLFEQTTKSLDIDSIKRANNIVIQRSTTKNFYNAVVYKYAEDSLEDKFLRGRIEVSANSISRIKIPNQPLTIEAKGLRDEAGTALLLRRNSLRFLQRYQYGAESLDVEVPFAIGWDVEVGDPIILGGSELQITDTKQGTRQFEPRIFEITNKRFNWRTGQVRLTLTDSSFNLQIRYGVFSPASKIVSATQSSAIIQDSYGTAFPRKERDKWEFYINRQIKLVSPDFETSEVTTLLGFNPSNDYEMLFETVSVLPTSGWYVRIPNYEEITQFQSGIFKQIHVFWTPQVEVTSVVSTTVIEVADVSKFFVGSVVRIHSDDFSFDTGFDAIEVTEISGNEITLAEPVSGVLAGHKIDLIGFVSDSGAAYAWV